jgi:UDP-N-acetylmuramoyl-L-alanyl-D-glutamate--2,6-diaminopimelate ligase
MAYCPKAIEIADGRKAAIRKAFDMAAAGDVILIAGKGHEDYVTIGAENIPYNDQQSVADLLAEE